MLRINATNVALSRFQFTYKRFQRPSPISERSFQCNIFNVCNIVVVARLVDGRIPSITNLSKTVTNFTNAKLSNSHYC